MFHDNCNKKFTTSCSMDRVLTELYEVLGQLRYPELAKIDQKDLATTVLTGQSRVTLLAWLLSHASPILASHLEKFQGNSLKAEVVKCYLQMGIALDENSLLVEFDCLNTGNCSTKHQLPSLKALLLFAKSLESTETSSIDDSAINEVLDKHIEDGINIIPTSCQVSMKLTTSEAKKYLDDVERTLEITCLPSACKLPESLSQNEIESVNGLEIENGSIQSLDSVSNAFSEAFESADFWRNSKFAPLPKKMSNIDETIHNLYKNLNSITQVLESKKSILTMAVPKCLERNETPLSLLIEDNVIFSEEIRSLYEGYLEN